MITCDTFRTSYVRIVLNGTQIVIQLHHETGVARPALRNLARSESLEKLRNALVKIAYHNAQKHWKHVQHCHEGVVQSHWDVAIGSYSTLAISLCCGVDHSVCNRTLIKHVLASAEC